MPSDITKEKIFLISFNKCATTSFHKLIDSNNISSLHWQCKSSDVFLAKKIYNNKSNKKDPLDGIDHYECFSDLTYLTNDQFIDVFDVFEYIYKHYPNSKYIFFDRPVEKWIKSRSKHPKFLLRYKSASGIRDNQKIYDIWRKDYRQHKSKVLETFKNQSNFLLFDIEKDDINKIVDFLPEYNIDSQYWKQYNKTKK